MELDIIKLQTTWNDAAGSLNNNFAKIQQAINTGSGGGGGVPGAGIAEIKFHLDESPLTDEEKAINAATFVKVINKECSALYIAEDGVNVFADSFVYVAEGDAAMIVNFSSDTFATLFGEKIAVVITENGDVVETYSFSANGIILNLDDVEELSKQLDTLTSAVDLSNSLVIDGGVMGKPLNAELSPLVYQLRDGSIYEVMINATLGVTDRKMLKGIVALGSDIMDRQRRDNLAAVAALKAKKDVSLMVRNGDAIISPLGYGFEHLYLNGINEDGLTTKVTRYTCNDNGEYLVSQEFDLYQEKLVTGANIKSINGQSILGIGNIEVGGGSSYDDTELRELIDTKQDELVSGGNIKTINNQDVLGSGNLEVGSVVGVDVGEEVDDVETHYATEEYVDSAVEGKQDTLISGENIKTINGQSVLGSGNITIQGGGSSYDDTELRNSLNAVTERVDDLSSEIADKYVKPDSGIPSSDLDVSVQESLEKADTAIQKVKTINGQSIEGEGNIDISGGGGSYDDTEIRNELSRKADVSGVYPDMTVGMTRDMLGVGEGDEGEFLFRPTDGDGSIKDGFASIEKMEGSSVVWNQILKNDMDTYVLNAVTFTNNGDGSFSVNGTASADIWYPCVHSYFAASKNHKYLLYGCPKGGSYGTYCLFEGNGYLGNDIGNGSITQVNADSLRPYIVIGSGFTANNLTFRPRVVDLTKMFGEGNEPTTIDEFYARLPKGIDINAYNEGEVVNMNVEGIKSVGFNAFNGTIEQGTINDSDGVVGDAVGITRTPIIKVLPNTNYYASIADANCYIKGYFYRNDGSFISAGALDAKGSNAFTTPSDASLMRVRFYRVSDDLTVENTPKLCIHLVHTGYRNGEYEPYVSDEIALPIADYFPNGMRSIGDVKDELTATEAIQRIGVVDLGELDWTKMEANGYEGFKSANNNLGAMPINHLNEVLCSLYTKAGTKWYDEGLDKCIDINNGYYGSTANSDFIVVRDTSYTDTASFKSAMSGVMLYYELAEPIVTTFDKPLDLDYQVWDFGTEEAIAESKTTPLKASIIYEFNARDTIRANKLALKNKADKTYVDEAIALKVDELTNEIINNEEVHAAAYNDLDSRLKDVGSLISGVAVTKEEFQEGIQSITNEIVENEEVHAAALNDLNNRISELAENVQGETITKAEFQSVIDSIKAMILANEEVHAAALNDLNTRISILENN